MGRSSQPTTNASSSSAGDSTAAFLKDKGTSPDTRAPPQLCIPPPFPFVPAAPGAAARASAAVTALTKRRYRQARPGELRPRPPVPRPRHVSSQRPSGTTTGRQAGVPAALPRLHGLSDSSATPVSAPRSDGAPSGAGPRTETSPDHPNGHSRRPAGGRAEGEGAVRCGTGRADRACPRCSAAAAGAPSPAPASPLGRREPRVLPPPPRPAAYSGCRRGRSWWRRRGRERRARSGGGGNGHVFRKHAAPFPWPPGGRAPAIGGSGANQQPRCSRPVAPLSLRQAGASRGCR